LNPDACLWRIATFPWNRFIRMPWQPERRPSVLAARISFGRCTMACSEQPRPLDPDHFSDLAATLGLDVTSFDTCMQGDADSRVRADMAEGRTLGVSGSPTFFFGRRSTDGAVVVVSRLTGARSLSEFRAQIDGVLTIPQ
jgi:hypothetical protein